MEQILRAALQLIERGERGALATVVRARGSTPQGAGARLLLRQDGSLLGTVGGGAIEAAVVELLHRCLADQKPRTQAWDLIRDLAMCCGGQMEVFVESIGSAPRLLVFGAGHVAEATAAVAKLANFSPWIIDAREELNNPERFPGCEHVLLEPKEAASRLAPTANDWLLIVTHDHRLDEEALGHFGALPHAYLGMIGSRRKVTRVFQRLQAKGQLPPLERVYTPVGLDIAAATPGEIAVSIVAELIALRSCPPNSAERSAGKPRALGQHMRVQGDALRNLLGD